MTVTLGFYCFQLKIFKTYKTSDDTTTGACSLGYNRGDPWPGLGDQRQLCVAATCRVCWPGEGKLAGLGEADFRKKEGLRKLSVSAEALGPSGRWAPPALNL